jgi:hypothetical protein
MLSLRSGHSRKLMMLASLSRPIRMALAVVAVSSTLATLAPAPALAADRGAVAAGILGGVALGALAAGALANPAPPPARRVYIEEERVYAPPPPPVYVERCTTETRRHWNGYRWVEERERFCD